MSGAVVLKEYDGARSVEMEVIDDAVYLEAGGRCYRFDRSIALRAIERLYGIQALALEDLV